MKGLENAGRRMVFWGALLLLFWAVYELSIRFQEMVTWFGPVVQLARDGKITLSDYFSRFDWIRLQTHFFLLGCVLLALFALITRGRVWPRVPVIFLCVLMGLYSLQKTSLISADLWQKLKLTPLVLIALGSAIGFFYGVRRGTGSKRRGRGNPPETRPYDPFGIKRQ